MNWAFFLDRGLGVCRLAAHGDGDRPDVTTPPRPPSGRSTREWTPWRRANEIRIKRAQLKRDLKAGRRSIHSLLLDPPEYVETAKVFDMLLAVPKYGRVKVNKLLVHCRIAPSKTIGGLSERQRSELISLLHH